MRTGLTKQQKVTGILFDEQSSIVEVQTHNTDPKKRLSEGVGNDEKSLPTRFFEIILKRTEKSDIIKKYFEQKVSPPVNYNIYEKY